MEDTFEREFQEAMAEDKARFDRYMSSVMRKLVAALVVSIVGLVLAVGVLGLY